MLEKLKDEPVITAWVMKALIALITYLAGRFVPQVNLTGDQAAQLAGEVFMGLSALWALRTRSKVVAVTKMSRVSAEQLGEPEHRNLMAAMAVKK